MTRTLTALAAAATIAIVAVAAPQQADARWRGGWGAPAIIGGLAAGAILGGAFAGPRYYGGYSAAIPAINNRTTAATPIAGARASG
jgi:hypothetical protein